MHLLKGCPATGFYGSNCSIPCPDVNCQYCHIETGYSQCCKPGYQGHQLGKKKPPKQTVLNTCVNAVLWLRYVLATITNHC